MTFRSGTEWDAEDIVQEAYTRALQYYDEDVVKNINHWFNTILNNTLRDHKNAEKGVTTQPFEEDEVEGIPCNLYPETVLAEITQLIKQRPYPQSEVLRLYFNKGYSAQDIGKLVENVSYSAAHQMITRFKNELKGLYQ